MQAADKPSTGALADRIRVAQQEVERLRAECVRSGALLVDHQTISDAKKSIAENGNQLAEAKKALRRLRLRLVLLYGAVQMGRARSFIQQKCSSLDVPSFVFVLFGGLACLPTFFVVCAVVGLSWKVGIPGGVVVLLLGFFGTWRLLTSVTNDSLAGEFSKVRDQISLTKDAIPDYRERYWETLGELQKLESLWQLRSTYEEQRNRLSRFIAELNDRKNELLLRNWRALRGIPFENFLEEVFEVLGFVVETTKITGDQGIDLIVSRSGERLSIQIKGYEGSVGNDSVQEAVAGMIHYRCHRCAVITNSQFTRTARDLAQGTGCILIDGSMIPDLIAGKVFAAPVLVPPDESL
jgi:Restriction endonuclease